MVWDLCLISCLTDLLDLQQRTVTETTLPHGRWDSKEAIVHASPCVVHCQEDSTAPSSHLDLTGARHRGVALKSTTDHTQPPDVSSFTAFDYNILLRSQRPCGDVFTTGFVVFVSSSLLPHSTRSLEVK